MSLDPAEDGERRALAALSRKPGEYSWRRASRRIAISLGATAVVLVMAGIAVATGGHAGIVISLLVLIAILLIYRESEGGRLDFHSDLKGYRGERMVADLLGMLEPLGFRINHGIEYTDASGYEQNIDHAVVGPTGVFAVETKNWSGRMWKADGDRLMHNGVDETGSVRQALGEAKELNRRLESGHAHVRWVQAVLVSTKSTLPDVRVEFKYVTLMGASDLVPYIRDRERILTDADVASAVSALV
jgi:hypothetical protein